MYFPRDLGFLGFSSLRRLVVPIWVPTQLLASIWAIEPGLMDDGLLGDVGLFDVIAITISASYSSLIVVSWALGVIIRIIRLIGLREGARVVVI